MKLHCLSLLPALFLSASSWAAGPFSAEVVAVPSADTLTLNSNGAQVKVRLFAVDAPENTQPFAAQARQWVSGVVLQQRVTVTPMATDLDGLEVVALSAPDGKDIASQLVSQGLAWVDTKNAPGQTALNGLQESAKAKRAGLWSETTPMAPWEFREKYGMDGFSYGPPAPAASAAAPAPAQEPKMPVPPAPPSAATTTITVKEKEFAEVEEPDYLTLMTVHQPRLVRTAAGEVQGLTAERIAEIPYASQLGFQNGDIISAVNGERITSEVQIFAMADRLHGAKRFEVDIVRAGAPHRVNIQVE